MRERVDGTSHYCYTKQLFITQLLLLSVIDPMINATVELYNKISVGLLPTPQRSHYQFSMRDISKGERSEYVNRFVSLTTAKLKLCIQSSRGC